MQMPSVDLVLERRTKHLFSANNRHMMIIDRTIIVSLQHDETFIVSVKKNYPWSINENHHSNEHDSL